MFWLVSFTILCFKFGAANSMICHKVHNLAECDKYQESFEYKKIVKMDGRVASYIQCARLCQLERELCLKFCFKESENLCQLTLYKNFNNVGTTHVGHFIQTNFWTAPVSY